ncbi:hypothetical protein HOC11_09005 [archaeon]|jgi:hypothetical protein|nr:hypothetical protein [archaeon]
MIDLLYDSIDQKLRNNPKFPDSIDDEVVSVFSTPINNIESALYNDEPKNYSQSPLNEIAGLKDIEKFKLRKDKNIWIGYGKTTLNIKKTGQNENLNAIYLQFMEDNGSLQETGNHRTTNLAYVLLVEDGTIGWYYRTGKSPLNHTGYTFPKGLDMKYGIVHPENTNEGIKNYISGEMLDWLSEPGRQNLIIEHLPEGWKWDLESGEMEHQPEEFRKADGEMDSYFGKPKTIYIDGSDFVEYTLDTDAFKAMLHMVDLSIDTYKKTIK